MKPRNLLWFALLTLPLACGCSPARGGLAGKVTLNGDALTSGRVMAFNDQGEQLATSSILPDGSYRLTDLPLGAVKLVVQTYQPDGQPVGAADRPHLPPSVRLPSDTQQGRPEANDAPTPVPLVYTDPKRTTLQATVVKGETSNDLPLTGKGEVPRRVQLPTQPGTKPGGVIVVPPR
jgi:hypothetical protein